MNSRRFYICDNAYITVEHGLHGLWVLYSYRKPVACIADEGNGNYSFHRLWDGHSQSTTRHINKFREWFGMGPIYKKYWLALYVEP